MIYFGVRAISQADLECVPDWSFQMVENIRKGYKILRRRLRIPERKQINLASYSVTGNKESVLAIFLIILRRNVFFGKLRERKCWNNHQSAEESGKLF